MFMGQGYFEKNSGCVFEFGAVWPPILSVTGSEQPLGKMQDKEG